MFGSTVAFLKLIWPFLKESMLEDGTVRDWVKRQWTTFVWIIFLVMMLLISLYLADIIRVLLKTNIEKNKTITERNAEIRSLNATRQQLNLDLFRERESNQRMRRYLLDLCRRDSNSCHFLIDETIVRPNEPVDDLKAQRVTDEWCLLVQGGDLKDELIRQRFLRECKVNVAVMPKS